MIQLDNITVYTVEECAKIIQRSQQTTRTYIKKGLIKGQRIGNRYYVTKETIKDFLKGVDNNK